MMGTTTTTGGTKTVTTVTATVTAGTETRHLMEFTEPIPGTLVQLSPEEVAKLEWVGTEPLLLPVWAGDSVGCVALFHSEQMDEYVEEALKHVVQGDGLEITQGELLKRIHDEVGIQAW